MSEELKPLMEEMESGFAEIIRRAGFDPAQVDSEFMADPDNTQARETIAREYFRALGEGINGTPLTDEQMAFTDEKHPISINEGAKALAEGWQKNAADDTGHDDLVAGSHVTPLDIPTDDKAKGDSPRQR